MVAINKSMVLVVVMALSSQIPNAKSPNAKSQDQYDDLTQAVDDSAHAWFDKLSFQADIGTFSATADSLASIQSGSLEFKPELSGEMRKSLGFVRISMVTDHDEHFENRYHRFEFFVGFRARVTLIPEYQDSKSAVRAPDLLVSYSDESLPFEIQRSVNPILICGGVFGGTVRSGYLLSPKTYDLWNNPCNYEDVHTLTRRAVKENGGIQIFQKAVPKFGEVMQRTVSHRFYGGLPILKSVEYVQGINEEIQISFEASNCKRFGDTYVPTIGREIRKTTLTSEGGKSRTIFRVTETRLSNFRSWERKAQDGFLYLPKGVLLDSTINCFVNEEKILDFTALDKCATNPKGAGVIAHKRSSLHKLQGIGSMPIAPTTLLLIAVAFVSGILGIAMVRIARGI